MLPGFSGHLISESFLERHIADITRSSASFDAIRRRLADCRTRAQSLGPASSLRALFEVGATPLLRELGFSKTTDVEALDGALLATLSGAGTPLLLVVTSWGERLEPYWRPGVVLSRRRGAPWCVLFNGIQARIFQTGRLYSRRYVQFDLDVAVDDERGTASLLSVLQASSFSADLQFDRLVQQSEHYGAAVRQSLRLGVLQASTDVLGALIGPRAGSEIDDTFEQALTIVYRILFLLFAEARGLVPLWHPIYRQSYSLEALRISAERSRQAPGLWDALRAVGRLAYSGCHAGDLHVTPFNGRLFAPSRTPLAERRDLDEDCARRALLALATRPTTDRTGREPVAYRDLGVEQLGAVYETVLDYEPRVVRSKGKPQITLERGSGRRKATGTFYTPQSIAQFLVRRALGPLVRNAAPDAVLNLKVLDPAMGSGAFLVAACTYLAQAYEEALVRAGSCHATDVGPQERAAIRRTVAERCLYGVDLNPMAVQLARLSLWLATLAADRPLTFLDHHLQAGDSLLGTWLACLRQAPTVRRRHTDGGPLPLFDDPQITDALRQALPIRFKLALAPNDTPEQVREKERTLAALGRPDTSVSRWKRIADLWCAGWFGAPEDRPSASVFGALSDQILTGGGPLPPAIANRYLERAQEIAASHRFFHWELEFPEVFFGTDGSRLRTPGFDAVLGNPPWDMIRADAGSADDRAKSRRDAGHVVRFTRDAGVYAAQSDGHANRYQLFVERAIALARAGGRIALVLPSGLTADHGSAPLRRLLFSRCDVDALVGFENRQRIFPIHRSVRFVLLSATAGTSTTAIGCRLGEHDPSVLEAADEEGPAADSWFPIHLTPDLLTRLSGDDLAIPDLRSPVDLAIAERAAALYPPLGTADGWAAHFGRELNATDDRPCFRPAAEHPIVGGKQITPFHVDLAGSRWRIADEDADRLLGSRYRCARLAYRDVASATNQLTLIAAVLPAGCVSTHTVFCLRTKLPLRAQYFLCGLFNSYVLNYLVRLRVATHVTTAIVERLPLPQESNAPAAFREIAAIARSLTRRSDPSSFAQLNALVATLYQLSPDEFAHVLSTFPLIPIADRDAALHAFKRL
jgi:hypothetical protein